MQFNDAWQQLAAKRPALADDDTVIEIKSKNLYSLLRQFYEQGQKHPVEQPNRAPPADMPDFLKGLFQ
jgi:hypothetical protein